MVNTNRWKFLVEMRFFTYIWTYQVSDKRQLRNCGNGERFLVETGTNSPLPSGRHNRGAEVWTGKSGNHRFIQSTGRKPDVLSRLSLQAGGRQPKGRHKKLRFFEKPTLHGTKRVKPPKVRCQRQISSENCRKHWMTLRPQRPSGMPNGLLKSLAVER